jgi:hypothetical protein
MEIPALVIQSEDAMPFTLSPSSEQAGCFTAKPVRLRF